MLRNPQLGEKPRQRLHCLRKGMLARPSARRRRGLPILLARRCRPLVLASLASSPSCGLPHISAPGRAHLSPFSPRALQAARAAMAALALAEKFGGGRGTEGAAGAAGADAESAASAEAEAEKAAMDAAAAAMSAVDSADMALSGSVAARIVGIRRRALARTDTPGRTRPDGQSAIPRSDADSCPLPRLAAVRRLSQRRRNLGRRSTQGPPRGLRSSRGR